MAVIVSILGGWRATIFAGLAIFLLCAYRVEHFNAARADSKLSDRIAAENKAAADAQIIARTREFESAIASAQIATDYERAKQNAQTSSNTIISDLRTGALQLRQQWLGCEADRVQQAAAGASELDAIERSREESAGRIVRAAAACDAQVASLQALVIADRKTVNGQP